MQRHLGINFVNGVVKMDSPISSIIFLIVGSLSGIFTGMLPGIHPNMLIPMTLPLVSIVGVNNYIYFLIGMVISHYFINYIPSAFLGIPDDETAVSVVPLHNLTVNGRGYEGIILCGIGGMFGIFLSVILSFILIFVLNLDLHDFYIANRHYIPIILISILIYSILISENKLYTFLIILLSGILGLIVLYNGPSIDNILTGIFTGMFAIPILINNLKTGKLPSQIITFPNIDISIIKSVIAGTLGGFFRIFLPAIGGAQINYILGKIIKEDDIENFLVSQGAITLSNEVFSIVSLLLIGYGRSGTSVAIKNLNVDYSPNLIFSFLIVSGFALVMLITLSKYILLYLRSMGDYGKISRTLLIFCNIIVFILAFISGHFIYYLIVYFISALIGILCVNLRVNMSNMMAVLVFPTVLYFI